MMFELVQLILCTIALGILTVMIDSNRNETLPYYEIPPLLSMSERSDTDDKDSEIIENEDEEWQKLANHESVPAGSHVKLNLQTGEKFIKHNNANPKKILKPGKYSTWNDVKQGIKQMKKLNYDKAAKNKTPRVVDYRKLDVILKELHDYEFPITTEDGILRELLLQYAHANLTMKMKILDDIEFLVHKYSFGEALVRLHGIEFFSEDAHDSTNSTLKAMIAMTLGSAMQGNNVVKEAVLRSNFIEVLLENLQSCIVVLQLRSAFALSTLLRNHRRAQDTFISLKGFGLFIDILNGQCNPSTKLVQKILTLILDLLEENDPEEYSSEELKDLDLDVSELEHRTSNLHSEMINFGICSALSTVLPHKNHDVMFSAIKLSYKFRNVCSQELLKAFVMLKNVMINYPPTNEFDPNFSEAMSSFNEMYEYLDKYMRFMQNKLPKEEL